MVDIQTRSLCSREARRRLYGAVWELGAREERIRQRFPEDASDGLTLSILGRFYAYLALNEESGPYSQSELASLLTELTRDGGGRLPKVVGPHMSNQVAGPVFVSGPKLVQALRDYCHLVMYCDCPREDVVLRSALRSQGRPKKTR